MSYFVGNVYSDMMMQDTQIHVILPQDGRRYIWEEKPKTLILLHGLSDNAATWVRRTAVERYAERYNLAVLMPEVQRSWYYDMEHGVSAYSYIAHELPELAAKLFHISIKREDMMIAGLSMGGYGALRCAITAPDVFGYCGAFSGAYDLPDIMRMSREEKETYPLLKDVDREIAAIVDDKTSITDRYSIQALLKEFSGSPESLPEVYMVCGTEDFLYAQTQEVKKLCEKAIPVFTYEEWHGIHEWDVWDEAIEKMLKHFLGEGRIDY